MQHHQSLQPTPGTHAGAPGAPQHANYHAMSDLEPPAKPTHQAAPEQPPGQQPVNQHAPHAQDVPSTHAYGGKPQYPAHTDVHHGQHNFPQGAAGHVPTRMYMSPQESQAPPHVGCVVCMPVLPSCMPSRMVRGAAAFKQRIT